MKISFQVRPQPIYKPERPVRDPLYRRFIKSLPCAACGQNWNVDPAHTGPHGLSQKACDLKCIPLCRKCHEKFDDNPQDFAAQHHLDIPALIERLNRTYELIKKAA